MDTKESCENTDIVIVGCGPTGTLLSALLGAFGIPNVVLEREAAITEDPRGIALDEDGIRQLQAVGIYDKVYSEIGSCEKFSAGNCSGPGNDNRLQLLGLRISYKAKMACTRDHSSESILARYVTLV
jgi:hypothetical protein